MAGIFPSLRRTYLVLYNWTLFLGWSQVLYLAATALLTTGHRSVYAAVEKPLLLAQSAALLEILHSLTGIVRSPVAATLPQVSGRVYVAWGILYSFPEIRTHFLVGSLVVSWSIAEIIRYSFFGLKEAFGHAPPWLLWLRYSTFLMLYPVGIGSEVGLIWCALPYMKSTSKYSVRMPNRWNFSFDYYYTTLLILVLYVPGSPHLYGYMMGQRRKALAKKAKGE
ncbi:Very-long-chain (3R)-3-hydroxyacyl-CoA dehydratase PASTICCINO 2 [Striga hermonthica]|uniref:Very-long-chain (3R)-3-hydroxyacyl-CoA dehydratase n=1 Tax=Striga hermonthica TaxID=68872 RepID=A0A9N7NC17_STRHE|nr:Very-long-chain (3R)-3-hydroxyacyl-CoA dehydratase PASTICCINO 2 [Striga hermonthica]